MAGSNKKNQRQAVLSARHKEIIQILAQSASKPVTVSTISEKIGVSSRTILREMPLIENWLTDNDFHFIRKPGIGLAINENDENLQLILELLEIENIHPMYSRQERRRHILGMLLFTKDPIKSFVFTSHFHISEGTLSDDLDTLGKWLEEYQIKIVRRQGSGVFLEGEETSYRQAISAAVFEFEDSEKILSLLSNQILPEKRSEMLAQNPLVRFLDEEKVFFVRNILAECEKQLSVKYMDSSYIGLMVRICLAIYRMQNSDYCESFRQDKSQLMQQPEWHTAGQIVLEIKKMFSIDIYDQEQAYIAMYLSSARIWSDNLKAGDPLNTLNVRQIVISMAGVVEQLTNLPFRSCTGMIDDLVEHVNAVILRVSMGMGIEHPQTDLVSQNYPEIYTAVEAACELLREFVQPGGVSKAEVDYIAMHFAAEAERLQENEQKVAVAVVCPEGIGSSKILAANLKKTFHNIEIRKIVSAFDIDVEKLSAEGIDLIISTAKLQTDFPHLSVGMVLQAQDRIMLQNKIEAINRHRLQMRTGTTQALDARINLDFIRQTSLIGNEIVEILQSFCIDTVDIVKNVHQLIDLSASVFGKKNFEHIKIAAGIRRREELGNTYFPDMHIYLFHCKTEAVLHSRFGYLRLAHPLNTEKGQVLGAVVMLVPDGANDRLYEPISRLSALLVESNDFLQALQNGDATAGVALAEEALVKYYQQEIIKRIGV